MRKVFSILFFILCIQLFAVPARRNIACTIKLDDGISRKVTLYGDENVHYFIDDQGVAYVGSADNSYRKADLTELNKKWSTRIQQRNEHRLQRRAKVLDATSTRVATVGQKKGLVILVNFSDKKLSFSQKDFNDFFNLKGYSAHGMSGSVHDYFHDCSYGQFDLNFDVVGPVTVSKTLSYYGKNNSQGDDLHAAEMVGEAVRLADKSGLNFKDYDWDGDGYVDQVYVIYAGYGESSGAPSNTIWPHEYELSSAKYSMNDGNGSILIDGVYVDTYACSNELFGNSGTKIEGIGTACHEFSHCLGIPDMYDTTGSSFGMSNWDVMDYGCYGNDGYCPVGYTSYERWVSGWLTPVELDNGCDVTEMSALNDAPVAYIIYNKANRNEFYLLENRQQRGWHRYDCGHGLLILHVDYDKNAWENNTVNNVSSHQRMTVIPADNNLSDNTDSELAGDPWPGTMRNTRLTDSSRPAASLFLANIDGRKYMGKPITDIAESKQDGTISFTFNGGKPLDVPQTFAVTDITTDGFLATWSPVERATSYELELKALSNDTVESGQVLIQETFSAFNNGQISDSYIDISEDLDDFTSVSGWSGYKVYCTPREEAKVGTGTVAGHITTPYVSSTSGIITLQFTLRPYGNDKSTILVKMGGRTIHEIELTELANYEFSVESDNSARFTLEASRASNCRFYVSNLTIVDGRAEGVPGKPLLIDSFKTDSCQFVFSGLSGDCDYYLCVRATDGRRFSDWSSNEFVKLLDIGNNGNVLDKLHPIFDTRYDQTYNLQGHSINYKNLPRGIYIKAGRKIVTF